MQLLNMLGKKNILLTSIYLHFRARKQLNAPAVNFCPHLGARNRLDVPAGNFCSDLAARKRLDAPAGNFCPHLGRRHATNRLDASAGNFCSDLAARNRLDAPAGDTVDQSVVLSYSIGFPSLGCKTVYWEHTRERTIADAAEWVRLCQSVRYAANWNDVTHQTRRPRPLLKVNLGEDSGKLLSTEIS